jgi:hypothetical protein
LELQEHKIRAKKHTKIERIWFFSEGIQEQLKFGFIDNHLDG